MDFQNSLFNINFSQDNPANIIQLIIGLILGYYLITQLIEYFSRRNHFKNSKNVGKYEEEKVNRFEGQFYIKGGRSQKYCRDDPSGLICNDDFPSGWDVFTFKYHGDTDSYTIKGPRGYYCSSSNLGLVCDVSEARSESEYFKIINDPIEKNGSIKIYAHNSPLPVADHGNGLRGDHRDEQGYDEFKLIPEGL